MDQQQLLVWIEYLLPRKLFVVWNDWYERIGSSSYASTITTQWIDDSTPETFFNSCLTLLIGIIMVFKVISNGTQVPKWIKSKLLASSSSAEQVDNASTTIKTSTPFWVYSIQYRFLPVFWLIRVAFWMSGPYFYAVYSSKVQHLPTLEQERLISYIFLVGFGAIPILGPIIGSSLDYYGRKLGTIMAILVYGLGAISTQFNALWILFIGRALGGIGTSMISNAPESWLVSEFQSYATNKGEEDHHDDDDDETTAIKTTNTVQQQQQWLHDIFGIAFSGDYIVAIVAGQIARYAASYRNSPTGPYEVSPFFLWIAAIIAIAFWNEHKAMTVPQQLPKQHKQRTSNILATISPFKKKKKSIVADNSDNDKNNSNNTSATTTAAETTVETTTQPPTTTTTAKTTTIWDALQYVWNDTKLLLLGFIQALFEASMYVFVMQWPPAIKLVVQEYYGTKVVQSMPYGTIFSCFMACCLLGSTLFSYLGKCSKEKSKHGSNNTLRSQLTSTTILLTVAAISLAQATYTLWSIQNHNDTHSTSTSTTKLYLYTLVLSFFTFECCVGIYFPCMGILRSQILPNQYRSFIMTLFGIPLNILVVIVFISLPYIGSTVGAMFLSTIALSIASLLIVQLQQQILTDTNGKEVLQEKENIIKNTALRTISASTVSSCDDDDDDDDDTDDEDSDGNDDDDHQEETVVCVKDGQEPNDDTLLTSSSSTGEKKLLRVMIPPSSPGTTTHQDDSNDILSTPIMNREPFVSTSSPSNDESHPSSSPQLRLRRSSPKQQQGQRSKPLKVQRSQSYSPRKKTRKIVQTSPKRSSTTTSILISPTTTRRNNNIIMDWNSTNLSSLHAPWSPGASHYHMIHRFSNWDDDNDVDAGGGLTSSFVAANNDDKLAEQLWPQQRENHDVIDDTKLEDEKEQQFQESPSKDTPRSKQAFVNALQVPTL